MRKKSCDFNKDIELKNDFYVAAIVSLCPIPTTGLASGVVLLPPMVMPEKLTATAHIVYGGLGVNVLGAYSADHHLLSELFHCKYFILLSILEVSPNSDQLCRSRSSLC